MRILYICTGNLCRSAFAEIYTSKKYNKEVRSRGILAIPGDMPPPEACVIGAELGYCMEHHKATQLNDEDLRWADIIFCMANEHYEYVKAFYPNLNKPVLLLGKGRRFAPAFRTEETEDPFRSPLKIFRKVFKLIQSDIDRHIASLFNEA